MKLKTLLQNHVNDIDKIKTSLLMNYYSDETDIEYEKTWEGYNDVISWLFGVDPITQTEPITTILVKKYYPDEELPGDFYVHVSGWDGEQALGLDLTDWREWLDMEIDEDSYQEFNEIDIIAHILWEMTFMGFTNEQVQATAKDINDAFQEYISEGKTQDLVDRLSDIDEDSIT